jgi:hypothetical protein
MKQRGTYIDGDLLTLSYKLQSNCTDELSPAVFNPVLSQVSKYWSREWLALLSEHRLHQMPRLCIHSSLVYANVIIDDKPPIVIEFYDHPCHGPWMSIHSHLRNTLWYDAGDHEHIVGQLCNIRTYIHTTTSCEKFVKVSYRIEYDEIATRIGYEKTLNNSVNISYEIYKKLVTANTHRDGYMVI